VTSTTDTAYTYLPIFSHIYCIKNFGKVCIIRIYLCHNIKNMWSFMLQPSQQMIRCYSPSCHDKGARACLFRDKDCTKTLKFLRQPKSQEGYQTYKKPKLQCKHCRRKHELDRTHCPAYGKMCYQCGKANHFHKICLQGKGGVQPVSLVQKLPIKRIERNFLQSKKLDLSNHKGTFLCHCVLFMSRDWMSIGYWSN